MNYTPLVSIIIPVYNGSNYLTKAIDSALAQTYSNCEILVINDGSKDNGRTRNIALSYGDKIRYFEKENGGVSTALNLGINNMQGDYFSWLSHDDEYHQDKIKQQINFLNKYNLQRTIVFTDFEVIDEKSRVIDIIKCHNKKLNTFDTVAFGLLSGCTLLIPRQCFAKVGLFSTRLPNTQDYDMWLRLSSNYLIKHLPEALVRTRQHGEQQSQTDNLYYTECNNFYIELINHLVTNLKKYTFADKAYFLKLAAYLKKVQYNQALDYLQANYLRKDIISKLKMLYYMYIDTSWGNSVGMYVVILHPCRFISRVYLKIKSRLRI